MRSKVSYSKELRDKSERESATLFTVDFYTAQGGRLTSQGLAGPKLRRAIERFLDRIARGDYVD